MALALLLAMILTALGGGALALLLWLKSAATAGARPLAGFLLMVGLWACGLVVPNAAGAALLATAPIGAAVYLHFAARISDRGGRMVAGGYVVGLAAFALAVAAGPGRFVPWPGVALLFRYEGAGLVAGAVTLGLAATGHVLLFGAWRRAKGLRRRQLAFVMASSLLGLVSISGLALPVFGIRLPPWPLLSLPVYLLVLAYAVLRYDLMAVNRWARLTVSWSLLLGLAATASALSAGLLAEQAGAPFEWTAVALVTGLILAAPVRRLADRIVYPGGEVSAADLAAWRRQLQDAADAADLTRKAESLLYERVGTTDMTAAPPGPRRVAETLAELVSQERVELERRHAWAERQRLAELGALAATVAHDLRNPMNIIAMAVADSDAGLRGEVKAQLGRMEALVRDLLDYAKPWQMRPEPVELADAITEAAAGMSLTCDIPPDLPLRADPLRLRQALANLLANAQAAGGAVMVAAERQDDAVLIHVCDDGAGIPDDIKDSLFRPFVSRGRGGTGLGLAIVAKVMAAHGGTAGLSKRPGWRTCFTLRFPA